MGETCRRIGVAARLAVSEIRVRTQVGVIGLRSRATGMARLQASFAICPADTPTRRYADTFPSPFPFTTDFTSPSASFVRIVSPSAKIFIDRIMCP